MKLIERDDLLLRLQTSLGEVARTGGRFVVLSGEAGIGKSVLVRSFCASVSAPVHFGACDPLSTPQPLGPWLEISDGATGELRSLRTLESDRSRLFSTALAALSAPAPVSVTVIEDAHWADGATLDLLRFLGRRIDRTRTLLLITVREDELGRSHPLRQALGDIATSPSLERLAMHPLSQRAVSALAEGSGIESVELYRQTGGNPFFVTEVIAAGGELSATVRDAALARASRLPAGARRLLDAAAVIGASISPELLLAVGEGSNAELEECVDAGILHLEGSELRFRHEIGRRAILDAISPLRLARLHRAVLRSLESSDATGVIAARLAHHAEAAGERTKTFDYSRAAAERAAELRSHREAASHFGRALRNAPSLSKVELKSLLIARQRECHAAGEIGNAILAIEQLIELARSSNDFVAEAEWLARSAGPLVLEGRNAEAESASRRSLEIVESLPVESVHAIAYRYQAALRMLNRDLDDAVAMGERALALAERFGDAEMQSGALNGVGTALLLRDDDRGIELLERANEVALAHGFETQALTALGNLGSGAGEIFRLEEAELYLRRALAFAEQRDLSEHYPRAWLALVLCYRGRWTESSDLALTLLRHPGCLAIARITALIALGRVRTRRGDPDAHAALDEALQVAGPTTTLQRIAPVQAARAEAAFLAGELDCFVPDLRSSFELACEHKHSWFAGELGYWLWRAGKLDSAPSYSAEPYLLQIEGEARRAAEMWDAVGAPYEAARARAESSDPGELELAAAACERLGARPLLQRIGRRQRELGVRGIARGPRPATRAHPAGLTNREVECLTLMVQGLRNSEIAERMYVSPKTVERHVTAIFTKLGVSSRMEAGIVAEKLLGKQSVSRAASNPK